MPEPAPDPAPAPAQPDELRDTRALARFDLFLFTAVATVLVVRAALAATGYPQVGGGGLHVAHVLWGGLLMAVALTLVEIMPGSRVRLRAAFIGGIGFGLFIDEVGKFVTKDVNYFYRPAVAIIYATFIGFYLIVREVIQLRRLTDRRRLALASAALSDLALGQLDRIGRDYALQLLNGVDDTSAMAEQAKAVRVALLAEAPARPGAEAWVTRTRDRVESFFERVLSSRAVLRLIFALAILEAADIVLSVALAIIHPGRATVRRSLLDTGLPSAFSAVLIVVGVVVLLAGDRARGIRLLRLAVLVELLFTQVVVFNRQQWLGLIGFGAALFVLGALRAAELALPGRAGPTAGSLAAV